MGPKHLLLLAAVGSAFLQDADMDYNDEDVTNFFDEVVVPMREAAKEALRPQAVVGPTNASSLQCSADQLTVRILEADRKLVIVGGGPAGSSAARQLVDEDLHQQRLHHASAVAENISPKRMDQVPAVRPRNCTMNGGLAHPVASVVYQGLPLNVPTGWHSFDVFA